MTPAVTAALSMVHYDAYGVAEFATLDEVNAFVDGVYEKFPPTGYGTSCTFEMHSHTKYVAKWQVFCAD
jgi:hypothetical protein